jgi:hypothetical protein
VFFGRCLLSPGRILPSALPKRGVGSGRRLPPQDSIEETAMTNLRILAATLIFALAGTVLAREVVLPVVASKAQFEAARTRLISQLETDKYTELKLEEKETVLKTLDRILSYYDKVARPDQLSDQDRVDMFNDQEIINTIVTHAAADSRWICERESTTGSHMVHVNCMTLATLKARQNVGQESMHRIERNANSSCTGAICE